MRYIKTNYINKIIIHVLLFTLLIGNATESNASFIEVITKSFQSIHRTFVNIKRRKLKVDDEVWPYLEAGKKHKETIVFIHGYGGIKELWIKMMYYYKKNYHVIAPDMPGFGEHKIHMRKKYTVPYQVKLLHNFFKKKGLKKFHMAGMSLGGATAGIYATYYSEQIKSLLLISPAGIKTKILSPFWKLYHSKDENALLYTNHKQFLRMLKLVLKKKKKYPRIVSYFFIVRKKRRIPIEKKIWNDLVSSGYNMLGERLHLIKSKTLVIWGGKDKVLHISATDIIQAKLKNATVKIFPSEGHAIVWESPKLITSSYDILLKSINKKK